MESLSRSTVNYEVAGHRLDEIANYHEKVVLDVMREMYDSDAALCQCAICLEDIYALALNSLPPRYVQETRVEVYRGSPGFIPVEEVRHCVESAVRRVTEFPSH